MKKLSEMKIHIIGIGGTGMSPIAVVLHESGATVTGSDRSESEYTADLRSRGIRVSVPQKAENITDPDIVFYSSAIHDDNPELAEARKRGIPTLKRREFLSMMLSGRKTIAIAGSHGKSTTTAMMIWVFHQLGLEPGFVVGSKMKDLKRNAAFGRSEWFIIEADEYDNMFLGLDPYTAVLTKVEYDHPDCFPTEELYLNAFESFLGKTQPDGLILLNGDDPKQGLIPYSDQLTVRRYGLNENCDFCAKDPKVGRNGCYTFDFCWEGGSVPAALQIPGLHNVYNAAAVLGVCAYYGLDVQKAAEALSGFHGIERRFEIVADRDGITLIDDYAHHPTEIRATLKAAREYFPERRIWAVWQPHTFSRTQSLLKEFSESFGDADEVIITDIFAARETWSGFGIDDVMRSVRHPSLRHLGTNADVAAYLAENLKAGDVVVTLSAGDANRAAPMALEMLKKC